MESAELEEALDDLETRLERLRSLYEQYFLGIEKVPPVVARTDVDRRIWALRKVQIRNTAKRYKLQTIIQRYNTFQQYWARICREIENGTYSPHVARARKQLDPAKALTIATRRRLGMYRHSSAPPGEDSREQALQQAESELASPLAQPQPERMPAAEANPWQDSGKKTPAATEASSLGAWQDPRGKAPVSGTTSSVPRSTAASSRLPPSRPRGPAAVQPGRTQDPSGRPPSQLRSPLPPNSPAAAAKPSAAMQSVLLRFMPDQSVQGTEPAAQPSVYPKGKRPPPLNRSTRPPAYVPRIRMSLPARTGEVAPAPQRPMNAPPSPKRPAVVTEAGPQPPAVTPTAAKHAPSPIQRRAMEAQAAPAQPRPEYSSSGHGSSRLTAGGVEQLHRQLVEAKRRNNEAGDVDLDQLRRKLEQTEHQLRIQHGNRTIDFTVVVKNGKAMIKPTVR